MIEFSLAELALFGWAIIATAAAFKYSEECKHLKAVIIHILDNKEARDKIVQAHENFMKERRS